MIIIPKTRGKVRRSQSMSDLTWLRVGGVADYFYQPADTNDLSEFLRGLPEEIGIFPFGVGSNLIIRDGGIRGVVIRLGKFFAGISVEGNYVKAGGAALDSHVARSAAQDGLDLSFLRTIPGCIGGAVKMNAGCYGSYVSDHLCYAKSVTRTGEIIKYSREDLNLKYRQSDLPDDNIVTEVVFKADRVEPSKLFRKMDLQLKPLQTQKHD